MTHDHDRRCRGSVYVMVLGSAMIVAVLGLSALLLARVQGRSDQWACDAAKARTYAHSAVQMGFLLISQDPDWRDHFPNGTWIDRQAIDDGTLTLKVIDPVGGDLAGSPTSPVVVIGIGFRGQAQHWVQVTLVPDIRPLEALKTCIHASWRIFIKSGNSVTVTGAPLSTNGELKNDGTVNGDVEAGSISHLGTITGSVTVPAAAKEMPEGSVFETYRSLATQIANPGTIENELLTPGRNPWGATNPDGVYYIDATGADLNIKNSRIHGTLVVKCVSKKLVLDGAVLLHSYRSDYPALIVDGDVEIRLNSAAENLIESATRNMNPPGSPYKDHSDGDETDEYPNEVQGLVHVKGALKLTNSARIRGIVICENGVREVTGEGQNQIIYTPSLYESPPMGYTFVSRMKISPGSWRQVVD